MPIKPSMEPEVSILYNFHVSQNILLIFFNHLKMLKPSLSLCTIQKQAAGQTGWLSGLVLPLGQGMILETRD